MSTNENTSLPDDVASAPAVPAQRSALLGPLESGWASVPELEGPLEPQSQASSAYLHGLRRHWVLATSLGLLCGGLVGLATWFLWGAHYTASAYFRIATSEPEFVEGQAGSDRFIQSAFDIYKDTQAQLVKSSLVLVDALRDSKVTNLEIMKREKDNPIEWLQDNLVVGFPGDAELMEVSLTDNGWNSQKEVSVLVNAVVGAYQKGIVDKERGRKNDRKSKLDSAYTEHFQTIRSKMQVLRQLAQTVGTDDPETLRLRQQMAMQTFADTQRQHSTTRVLLDRTRGELRGQKTLLADVDTMAIPQIDVEQYVNDDPRVRQLYTELSGRMMAMAETQRYARPGVSGQYVDPHGDVIMGLEEEIRALGSGVEQKIREKMRSKIVAEITLLDVQVDVLADQEQRLAQDVAQQEKKMGELSKSSIDLELMRSEIDRLNVVLTNIHDERERLRVEIEGADKRIALIQSAEEPRTESKLGIRIALTVMASLLGLCIPIGSVTWWDTRAKRINSQADVSRGLGLTVLGSVPTIPGRVIRQLGSSSMRNRTWNLRLTESIDGIAARLLHQAEVDQSRVILISSAGSGEGKTTLATHLARSLARNGRRTVLVDFDLRRPAFDKALGLPLEPGVSEVLRGQSDITEVVRETGTDNLHVVTAGRLDRHALTALANGVAGSLFDELRAEYEFVVIDAAPILPVADTRFVSQHVDTVILSVFRDISRAPKITAACEILEAFGVSSVEAVVTGPTDDLPAKDMRYGASIPA